MKFFKGDYQVHFSLSFSYNETEIKYTILPFFLVFPNVISVSILLCSNSIAINNTFQNKWPQIYQQIC